jgi:hypothetical protein
MVKYAKPRPGYKFALTQKGFEVGKVRVKFDEKTGPSQYRKAVPEKWVNEGYVVEVEDK